MRKIKELPKGTWKEGDKYCRTCPECDKVIFHKSKRNLIFQYKNKYSCRSCGAKRANEKKKLSMPEDTWENGDKYCRNCPDCDNIISYSNRYSMICAHNNKTVCIKCAGKKYPKGKDNALFIPLPKGCWEDNNKFYRNCPECDDVLYYKSKGNLIIMYNRNSLCRKCGNKKAGQSRVGNRHSEEWKKNQSKSMKGINKGSKNYRWKPLSKECWENDNKWYRFCPKCNDVIEYLNKSSLCKGHINNTNCKKCVDEIKIENLIGYCYNYRVFYKDLILRSRWELEFVKRLEELNIKFEYEPKRFKLSNGKTYIPDFYLLDYNRWIEIKGWVNEESLEKHKLIQEDYSINIEMINNLDKIKNFAI